MNEWMDEKCDHTDNHSALNLHLIKYVHLYEKEANSYFND